jgi:hypothetical protein
VRLVIFVRMTTTKRQNISVVIVWRKVCIFGEKINSKSHFICFSKNITST